MEEDFLTRLINKDDDFEDNNWNRDIDDDTSDDTDEDTDDDTDDEVAVDEEDDALEEK